MGNNVWKVTLFQFYKNKGAGSLLAVSLVAWLILFGLGLAGYSGSKAIYGIFSIVTGAMLMAGVAQTISYGYLFLTIFLWLGFWLKLTIHTIFSYPFVEPVGYFSGRGGAWDEVLISASVACMGVMLGRILILGVMARTTSGSSGKGHSVPRWYTKQRKWLWTGLVLLGVTALVVNEQCGLQQVGLQPRTILMWPLNAIVSWMLNIGIATGIAVFTWWDIGLKKNAQLPFVAILTEAFLSSVSVLSRAVYVFHTIPQFWAISRHKQKLNQWSLAKTALMATLFILFLVLSISAVTTLRNYLYQSEGYSSTAYQVAHAEWEVLIVEVERMEIAIAKAPIEERAELLKKLKAMKARRLELAQIKSREDAKWAEAASSGSPETMVLLNEFGYQMRSGFATRILQLSVDRWIGLEGLMSVQAYPEKNMTLLGRALSEKQESGKTDIYQSVSKSIYLKTDGARFRFRSLPGVVAFLYYGNSLWVVLLGMMFFTGVVLGIELLLHTLTANPIICSLYGAMLASNIAQFGGSPLQSGPYILMLSCGIMLVWLANSPLLERLLGNLRIVALASSGGR